MPRIGSACQNRIGMIPCGFYLILQKMAEGSRPKTSQRKPRKRIATLTKKANAQARLRRAARLVT